MNGFPTIYFAKPGMKKEPFLLSGKRDYDSLVKFIEQHSDILKSKEESQAKKEEL